MGGLAGGLAPPRARERTLGGAPDWPPLWEWPGGRPTSQWPRLDAGYSDDLGAPTGMLESSQLVAFVATTDLDRANNFYGDVLGLVPVYESPIVRVFNANGTKLRVTLVDELVPAPFTVLGWTVDDIEESVGSLRGQGRRVRALPADGTDELGVWTTPGGDRVAWFRDPDGNVLSLTQTH